MSAVSSCGSSSCSDVSSDIDKLRQSYVDKLKNDDKAAAPRQIDDVVDVAQHDDIRVAVTAKADFGTSFDNSAPGRRVNIRA